MFRKLRTFRWAVVLGCLPLAGVAPAAASEVLTDIILLVDTSASMREIDIGDGRTISFEQLTQRLQTFVDAGLPTNSNVTLITFGEEVRTVLSLQVKDTADRKRLQKALGGLKADERRTYTTKALWYGISEIARLKKEFPTHYRLLFLLSDGDNNPPPEDGPPVSFDQVRAGLREPLGLRPDEDFYLWYAHIGDPDPEVQRLTAEWEGDRKPFEGDWRIGRFNFNRRTIHLPAQLPGDWTAEFPSRKDIERGDTLSVQGYGVDGRTLKLGPVVVPQLPADAKIEVSPAEVTLTDRHQQVALQFHGTAVPPGKYTARVQMTPPPGFVISSPRFFHLDFQVARPAVSVEPADKLHLGTATPVDTARGRIVMNPTPSAALLKTNVTVRAAWDDAPEGLKVDVQPSEFELTNRQPIEISAAIGAEALGKPGVVTGRLLFASANRYLVFEPAEVPVSLELKPQAIRLSRSEFPIEPQPDGTFELALSVRPEDLPPDGAAFSLGTAAPMDPAQAVPELRLQPASGRFTAEQPVVKITGTIAGRQAGTWAYRIPLESDTPFLVFDPPAVLLTAGVAMPRVELLPADRLDFGNVNRGTERVLPILLVPNEAAIALKASVDLAVEGLTDGVTVACDPQSVLLDGRREVQVTLQASRDAAEGSPENAALRLAFSPESVAAPASAVALDYHVLSDVIHVDTKSLLFENILPDDSKPKADLRVVGGEGVKGKVLTATLQWEELPPATEIVLSPQQFTLAGTSETIPVALTIKNAVAGTYRGFIVFEVDDAVVKPAQIPATVVIGKPAIVIYVAPIRVPEWSPGREYRWPVIIEVNRFADGAVLALDTVDLPPGVAVAFATPEGESAKELKLARGKTSAELILLASGCELPSRGTSISGTITFHADRPDLLVENASVPIELRVPWLTSQERVGLLFGGLALVVAAIAAWFICPRRVRGTITITEKPANVTILFQGAKRDVGERLAIGQLRQCSILLGSGAFANPSGGALERPGFPPAPEGKGSTRKRPRRTAKADVVIQGDSAVGTMHAKIFRRGKRHRIKALHPVSLTANHIVGKKSCEVLYNGDQIRLGQVVLTLGGLGGPKRPRPRSRRGAPRG